ncbi:phage regulatory protein/antirepressor Ant [Alistipes putredinis]|jgi:Rha family phage regulatory protein|uniref:Phage regulatory protein, Rha family n=1 Tax=Alistipes putredinis DSM 17216 TaxID=445970 RepID=B0MXA7_9BACT|nr:phage regulatory protein/antirepressor Ant [Alistipes putredinis]EDS02127.1 phage regulatory protein, Rha family [Alistipes putredinis DSM 17216]
MNALVIQGGNGRDVTTSLIVSQVFGKEHAKVVRDIESLSCSTNFNVANFGVIEYTDTRGRIQKAYEMTKDGFSFLVMGYTGAKAGQFKEMFIAEFNKREAMLKNDDYILARSQEILHNRLKLAEQQLQIAQGTIEKQEEAIKTLTPKAQYTDEVLQSTSTYTLTQIAHDLGLRSVHALTRILMEKKMLYRQSGQWQPTAKVADKGYFDTRTAKFVKSDNTIGTSMTTVITESGRQFLHSLIGKEVSL